MSVWEEIKQKLDLAEVIGEYVRVQPSGANYRAVCPFHREKTPSLMISPEKGIWHCFGCGQGGDVFKFVMQIENLTRQEALQKLAKRAGVQLEQKPKAAASPQQQEEQRKAQSEFEAGSQVLEWSTRVYHKILLKLLQDRQNPVTRYILERGLNQETVVKFRLGYAPRGNFLLGLARKHAVSENLLTKVGLFKELENGGLADKFSDRLMIPVFDKNGRTVGFTGRILPYDQSDRPKYLNSPQTPWFNKSELWYGWHLARRAIIQDKHALVVEGNMDVISTHLSGLEIALASQGTSFTGKQLSSLKNLTRSVWLAFDNDEAGVLAGAKFFKAATQTGLEVRKVLIAQQYKDLDEYLTEMRRNGQAAELRTQNYLDYYMELRQPGLGSPQADEQKKTILEVLDLLGVLDDLSLEQYLIKLSDMTKISVNTLRGLVVKAQLEPVKAAKEVDQALDARPVLTTDQTVLTTWQKLLALSFRPDGMQSGNALVQDKLIHSYPLLRHLMQELEDSDTVQEYVNNHRDELELIYSQEKPDADNAGLWWQAIQVYLDQNVGEFMLSSELKDAYLKVKQSQS